MLSTELHHMQYASELRESLERLPWPAISKTVELLYQAWSRQKNIYIMGNGGSAATAIHMAADLNKNTALAGAPRVRAVSLCENISLLTAIANDLGYENIFHEQLLTLCNQGDVVVAISGSGNSENVLRGVRTAHRLGASTVGLTGFYGGQLAELVDVAVVMPVHNMEQIEDLHMVFSHSITSAMRNLLQQAAARQAA